VRNALRRSSHAPDLGGEPIPLAREPGDRRCEVELAARGYAHLSPYGLSFDCGRVLPDFDDPSRLVWPGLRGAARGADGARRATHSQPCLIPGRRNTGRPVAMRRARQFERQERDTEERRRRELAAGPHALTRAQDQEGG